ncbi:HpcH/HpaI aldolase/citrate lyase family protein [Mycolicibacterium sp.]|uniref:HpcH/HpaI aldolase/citrate lyase family protein n=1 Tax=Mycolicibacterium sp. TaxID=2320850 RepID=UPI003D0E4381
MRSLLFAPAHKPNIVQRALSGSTGADRIVVDLEDGVPDAERPVAVATLTGLEPGAPQGTPALCRIRAADQGGDDDLPLVGARFCGVMLAKAESPADVAGVRRWLTGRGRAIELWLLIETARGLLRLDEMLAAAPVDGVMFGAGDMQADLRLGDDVRQLDAARSRIVFSCIAAGVRNIVDTPEAQLRPGAGYLASARSARGLGFTAKAAIHPAQLPAIHQVFGPSAAEIDRATAVLAMPDGASRDGAAMVDEATKRWARGILASIGTDEENNHGA